MQPPLHGAYIQELIHYRPKTAKRIVREILRRGATTIAWNADAWVPSEVQARKNPSPFRGRRLEINAVKNWYWRTTDQLIEMIQDEGGEAGIYGPMFPDVRRGGPTPPFVGITNTDWSVWRDPARQQWLLFWDELNRRYEGGNVYFVDGTEPFTTHLERPPNDFTASVQAITPGVFRAGIDEVHYNPGDAYESGTEAIYAGDGWGRSSYGYSQDQFYDMSDEAADVVIRNALSPEDAHGLTRQQIRDLAKDAGYRPRAAREIATQIKSASGPRRIYAGLPADGDTAATDKDAARATARYFDGLYRQAHQDGRETFLVLHTPGWSAFNHASAINPDLRRLGYPSGDTEPFGTIYRRLARTAAALAA